MKSKLVAFASILCIASLMASGANADKPEDKGKPGKPDDPPGELIVFTGDLQGWAHVEGCCLKAGPSPRYTMYLENALVTESDPPIVYSAGDYDGELFMNGYGAGQDREYIVQFHACCTADDSVDKCKGLHPELKFQIIGGTPVHDKKNKVLTVTFEDEPYWADTWDWNRDEYAGTVSFEITRAQPSCTDAICDCPNGHVSSHLCPSP